MARLIGLNVSPWQDVSLSSVAQRAEDWGYDALELSCTGSHCDLAKCAAEPDGARQLQETLQRHELTLTSLGVHGLGQVIGDVLDARHKAIVPPTVWGDGRPEGVKQRAIEHLRLAAQLAEQLGVHVLVGYVGSLFGNNASDYPPSTTDYLAQRRQAFLQTWEPILRALAEHGVRFALHLHPGQAAFDLQSAETVLDVLGGNEDFGFALDPAALYWQGLDPAEFVRRFPERIMQVRVRDAAVTLNGRSGLLCGHLPDDDPRRGWEYRAPGRGGVAWEGLLRSLERCASPGSLVVDWRDPDQERDAGAAEAIQLVRRFALGQHE